MNPILLSEKQRIDNLFDRISKLPVDEEFYAHWSRYLCVLISGFIENAMRILLTEYSKNKSHPNVSNYVSKQIKGITNLNNERILQLLGSFDSKWRTVIEQKISDAQKDAIDSIVANRHNIVHGRSVGITITRVKNYYLSILAVISTIESDCLSD